MAAAAVRYTKNYEKIKRAFLEAETAGLKNVGRQMVSQATLNITKNGSVDTGNLRGSLSYSINGEIFEGTGARVTVSNSPTTVYIGTNVSYAPFVEFGTKFIKEKSYLRSAYAQQEGTVKKIVDETIKAYLKRV